MIVRLGMASLLLIAGFVACSNGDTTKDAKDSDVPKSETQELVSPEPDTPPEPTVNVANVNLPDYENWFGIYLGGNKLGYAHETMTSTTLDDGSTGYTNSQTMRMDILSNGQLIPTDVSVTQTVDADFNLVSFALMQDAMGQARTVTGERRPGTQDIVIDNNGTDMIVTLDEGVSSEAFRLAIADELTEGETFTYRFFDPAQLKVMRSTMEYLETESIYFNGVQIEASTWRFNHVDDESGNEVFGNGMLVVDESGLPLRYRLADMLEMRLEDEVVAQSDINGVDIFDLSAIPLHGKPEEIDLAEEQAVRVLYRGPTDLREFQSFDSQRVDGPAFVINTSGPTEPYENDACRADVTTFTASDDILTANDEDIQSRAQALQGDNDWDTVNNIVAWVFRNTAKQPSGVILSGADLIEDPRGDCKHHAILAGSLFRAAGIPSRVVGGLIYLDQRRGQRAGYYYHAWNEVLIGCTWYQVDPAFNESPAGANHLILDTGLDAIQSGSLVLDFLGEDVSFEFDSEFVAAPEATSTEQ